MGEGVFGPRTSSDALAGQRLESWKEIAAYLKRDVRTVQRWEKREGLPVHRHLHDKLGSVYAHRGEIDGWWNSRRFRLEELRQNGSAGEPTGSPASSKPALRFGLWAAAGIVILAASLALLFPWRTGPSKGTARPTLQQVATIEWAVPRISPDGKWLAYQEPASHHLSLKEIPTGLSRPLVPEYTEPAIAWSRDSGQLAYLTNPERYDRMLLQLETIEVANGARKVLWQGVDAGLVEPYDWSPDGAQLLCRVAIPGGRYQVAFVRTDNRAITTLATMPSMPQSLHISPDGRFIAYSREQDYNWDLFLLPVQGERKEIRLTEHPGRDSLPFWSPDGRHLVFLRRRGSSARLWAMHIDAASGRPGGTSQLAEPGNRSYPVSITADGSLYFSHRKRPPQVVLLDLDARTRLALGPSKSAFEDDTFDPSWSADGRRLFVRKVLPGGDSLLVERNLANGGESTYRPPSSYDVSFLVRARDTDHFSFFGSAHGQRRGFYDCNRATGQVQSLWTEVQEEPLPPASWSPSGQSLLFSTRPGKDGRFPVLELRPAAQSLRTLVWSRSRPFPHWSPKGDQIAYTDKNCLMVLPAAGGEPRQLACGPASVLPRFAYFSLGGLDWSPDGRTIAWTFHNEPQRKIEIWLVDCRTGNRSVAWSGEKDYGSWPNDPAWSPDGRRIAIRTEYKPEYEIWRLSSFLP